MPHPHRRTWTLGGLDREQVYRLWFDPEAFRWEVAYAGGDTATAGHPHYAGQGVGWAPPRGACDRGGAPRTGRWTWVDGGL